MFQVPLSPPERNYHSLKMAKAKSEGRYQPQISPKSQHLYTNDMSSFGEPWASVENVSKIDTSVGNSSMNAKHFLNRRRELSSKEANCLREPEANLNSMFPRIASENKPCSWLDTFSNPMSTSPSRSNTTSDTCPEFRHYLSSSSMNSDSKTWLTTDDSEILCRDLSVSNYHRRPSSSSNQSDHLENAIFELIKAQCLSNPTLMEKVVNWSSKNSQFTRITQEDIQKQSQGRLWVAVRSSQPTKETDRESLKKTLDDIKGAYQEVGAGVFTQPKPWGRETEIQHRLSRDSVGLWLIEKYDLTADEWCLVAKQKADGRWFDCGHNCHICVMLIPMRRILNRLRSKGCLYQDISKSMEFLFTSCDQKKLNGKLKTRTLKHNIANLKNKLEKQYALSFAILVANAADKMSNGADILDSFEQHSNIIRH